MIPDSLFQHWIFGYRRIDPHAQLSYQPIGSGAAFQLLREGRVDLGTVEMPLSNAQISQMPNGRLLHFPAVLTGVVPICNIGGTAQALNFSGEVLAAVFLGRITRWDDPAIRALNPNTTLPAAYITVIHRADGAGATFVFTDYLSAVSSDWHTLIGTSTSVQWFVGLGGKGNEGVAGLVRQIPNALGYVDVTFAQQVGLKQCSVRNRTGRFVTPSPDSLTAAATYMVNSIPSDFRVSLVNAPGPDAYPIASFIWLVVPDRFSDPNKKEAAGSFLSWVLTQGQSYAAPSGYAPLPRDLAARAQAQIGRIQ